MGQRLLLVDSDRAFLKEHQVSLESAFDLEVVSSPEGVAQRLEGGAHAAVMICVEVADNKGYALCSTIRKNARLDGVKVILISAKATEEEYRRHQSLKGKADLYLHKPIAPSALVAALSPFVPGRTLDPDNPLGELVDTELGDDWLDGLKGPLEDAAPVFSARPDSPVQTQRLDPPRSTAPADTSRAQLLDAQVAALHDELRAKDQQMAATMAELQQLHRRMNSVTLNLDDLERSRKESEALKARLAETEAALKALEETKGREGETAEALKAQLREALAERGDLIAQVESLNQQVSEKTQRTVELLKERDRLQQEALDFETTRAKAADLEAALALRDEELTTKRLEVEAARQAEAQLHETLEALVQQHQTLEGVHQAALLEAAGLKERLTAVQMETAGLEATLKGQGRDLAELGSRLQQAEEARDQARAQALAAEEALAQLRAEAEQAAGQAAALQQELDEAKIQHEGERLELMNGLDLKDGEINRLNRFLGEHQDAKAQLEQALRAAQGQMSELRDRLQGSEALFQEIQDRARRGAEAARG